MRPLETVISLLAASAVYAGRVPEPRNTVGCNQVVNAQPGGTYTIQSPNYPSNYPSNANCNYKINVPDGLSSTVNCAPENWNLKGWTPPNCWGDSLEFVGKGKYCERWQFNYAPLTYGPGQTVEAIFRSNGKNEDTGFSCTVQVEGGVTSVCDICGKSPGDRIVNGQQSQEGEHPWQVRWTDRNGNGGVCGGTIVGRNTVITAAHCTQGVSASEMRIWVGSHSSVGEDGKIFTPSQVIQHPNYDARNVKNDITILKFDQDLLAASTSSRPVAPACIAGSGFQGEVYGPATVSGWGTTSSGGNLANTLRDGQVDMLYHYECEKEVGSNYDRTKELCALGSSSGGNVDSCQGDSGGPLIKPNVEDGRATLTGVVSWGYGCAESPGVYARVSAYEDWILSNVGDDVCVLPEAQATIGK